MEIANDDALAEALVAHGPATTIAVLPGAATVCRTVLLPDVEEAQLLEALRLQAEARLLGGTADHRRAMAPLDAAQGETTRTGIVVAWPDAATVAMPACLADAMVVPDAAALSALIDGVRPIKPVLFADAADGTVTIALTHANGLALRATREDFTDAATFRDRVVVALRETAISHNHTESFAQELANDTIASLPPLEGGRSMLLLPDEVRSAACAALAGCPQDEAWWCHWGVAAGAALCATGPLAALATMQSEAPVVDPPPMDRLAKRLSQPRLATRLVVAALIVLAIGPAVFAGARLALLQALNPDLDALYQRAVEARKQQVVYDELGETHWPMTKIVADIVNNTPVGIEIETLRLDAGEPASIRGRAIDTDGRTAAELIAQMQQDLQATGLFKDIQFTYDAAQVFGGDREFDLWTRVVDPLRRPRYALTNDFGRWTLAMRQDNIPASEAEGDDGEPAVEETPSSTDTGDTPLASADAEDTPNSPTANGTGARSDRGTTPRSEAGGGDISSRSEDRVGGRAPARVPEPLTREQVSVMSGDEARIALRDVALALRRLSSDDPLKTRLRDEQRMLLDRLKELP